MGAKHGTEKQGTIILSDCQAVTNQNNMKPIQFKKYSWKESGKEKIVNPDF